MTARLTLTQTAYSAITQPLYWLLDALYPRRCLGCRRYGSWCCVACLASLTLPRQQKCPGCNAISPLGAFCPDCQAGQALEGLWTALPYGNQLVRNLVRAVKYDGLTEIVPILAGLAASVVRAFALPPAWHHVPREHWYLTSVPLAPKRARTRGFNQSELLTQALSAATGLATANVLRRRLETKPQAELSPGERLANVTNAFALAPGAQVTNKAYVLVDDVYTTGATLEECAKVLKNAGASEVWGLTVAYG